MMLIYILPNLVGLKEVRNLTLMIRIPICR